MQNYFNYFTEIEDHFQRRRGTLLLLSTLDWALIETWKDAGIPLEAVLRGIDNAMDKYDRRPSKTRKVNSLAYCAQEVLAAAEDMKEAAVGSGQASRRAAHQPSGMEASEIASFLKNNASQIAATELPEKLAGAADDCCRTLETLAAEMAGAGNSSRAAPHLEDLERHLTVLEEKLFAAILASTPDAELLAVRREADNAIAPYRSKMGAPQIQQLHQQFVNKRLLEHYNLPRLSLFYMPC